MKRIVVLVSCLFILSCKSNPGDKFVGNWTDGTWRHISIEPTSDGYLVDDISMGHKKCTAKLLGDQLIVTTSKGISIFNYSRVTDGIFAGAVNFHREAKK